MGRAKAGLLIRDETMLARQVRLLSGVCRRVWAVGPAEEMPRAGVPVIADEVQGRGPLGGIYSALHHCPTEFALVVSCDLPFMESRFLRLLAKRAFESRADAVVPESREGFLQPLSAVYRRRLRRLLRARLERGENTVRDFLARARIETIRWPEIARAGFPPRIFANMNTPEEYEDARRSLAE
jgi:molybdopterin-guanine dinucleotide biosynthesis protein A